jgi:catechol 2,3-dioxygenase-like lactoylglutathione lyase family enzyme
MGIGVVRGATATVLVRDVERAVRFYTDRLGLHLRASHVDPVADWAEVEAPGLRLLLVGSGLPPAREPAPVMPAPVAVGFEVEDLEAAMRALRRRGIGFEKEIAEGAEHRIAWFTDPDGNSLYLRQERGAAG